jgi:hypothetical protein
MPTIALHRSHRQHVGSTSGSAMEPRPGDAKTLPALGVTWPVAPEALGGEMGSSSGSMATASSTITSSSTSSSSSSSSFSARFGPPRRFGTHVACRRMPHPPLQSNRAESPSLRRHTKHACAGGLRTAGGADGMLRPGLLRASSEPSEQRVANLEAFVKMKFFMCVAILRP